jgi:hypothetical protein
MSKTLIYYIFPALSTPIVVQSGELQAPVLVLLLWSADAGQVGCGRGGYFRDFRGTVVIEGKADSCSEVVEETKDIEAGK